MLEYAEQILLAGEGGWDHLSPQDLDQAILQHRICIRDLLKAMPSLPDGGQMAPVPMDPMQVDPPAGNVAPANVVSREPTPAPSDSAPASTSGGAHGLPSGDLGAAVGAGLNGDDLDPSEWQVPPHCIPIHANVTTYDWRKVRLSYLSLDASCLLFFRRISRPLNPSPWLLRSQLYEAAQFDVIMMDPPWQLATSNPTRGVSLGYR